MNLKWSSASQPLETIPRARLFSLTPPPTFTNPIIGEGADPWVTRWNNQYFYVRSDGGAVWVEQVDQAPGHRPGAADRWSGTRPAGMPYSQNVWAPELHYLDGKWYIYVAADDGDNANHRMHVLEGNTQDPQGTYMFKGKIAATTDRWAIDGTVLEHNGYAYFVWSGWPGFDRRAAEPVHRADVQPVDDQRRARADQRAHARVGAATACRSTRARPFCRSDGTDAHHLLGQRLLDAGVLARAAHAQRRRQSDVRQLVDEEADAGVHAGRATSSASATRASRSRRTASEDWIVYHAHNNPVDVDRRPRRAARSRSRGTPTTPQLRSTDRTAARRSTNRPARRRSTCRIAAVPRAAA